MKKLINSKKTLKKINNITFILLLISAGFIAFNKNILIRLIGVLLTFISLIIQWRLYRCPHCNHSLDPRLDIDKNIYCPNCGKKI